MAAAGLTIVSWNVNGLRALLRRLPEPGPAPGACPGGTAAASPGAAAAAAAEGGGGGGGLRALFSRWGDPDVVCLQETKVDYAAVGARAPASAGAGSSTAASLSSSSSSSSSLPADAVFVPGFESFWSCSLTRRGYSGVAVYAKAGLVRRAWRCLAEAPAECRPAAGSDDDFDFLEEGRLLACDFGSFVLHNVYFPNSGMGPERVRYKLAFSRAFSAYCLRLLVARGAGVCVVGDVNVVHRDLDMWNGGPTVVPRACFLPEERAWLSDFLEAGFVDTYRHHHGDCPGAYTWWDQRVPALRKQNRGWRLDYALADAAFCARGVVDSSIMREQLGSDHCPVVLRLASPAAPPLAAAAVPGAPAPEFSSRAFARKSPPSILSFFRRAPQVSSSSSPVAAAPAKRKASPTDEEEGES